MNAEKWQERMLSRVKELGFESFEHFLSARAGAAYAALASELGDFMPVMVEDLQMRRASQAGESAKRVAAMDSLVRVFRDLLPGGWDTTAPTSEGVEPSFMNIVAGSNWSAMLRRAGIEETVTDAVWDAIQRRVQAGWRPTGVDDAVIVAAFDEAWPA